MILLWLIFLLAALVLTAVVLLQESKGGGLAEAFGGTGAETFGVKSSPISRFTFTVATVMLVSAVTIHILRPGTAEKKPPPPSQQQPK